MFCICARGIRFLAKDTVVRIATLYHLAQSGFDLSIEGGDETAIRLQLRSWPSPPGGRQHRVCHVGEIYGKCNKVVEVWDCRSGHEFFRG